MNTNKTETTKCPHCKGELSKNGTQWQYYCKQCYRAWVIKDKIYWLALFDASGHIYRVEQGNIEEIRQTNPLWRKLLNKWSRER